MKLITEREMIRTVAARWRAQYAGYLDTPNRLTGRTPTEVAAQLDRLDPETATPADVAAIIGNDSWTRADTECDECGQSGLVVVQVGEEPDYESATARLCLPCAERAVAMLRAETEAA